MTAPKPTTPESLRSVGQETADHEFAGRKRTFDTAVARWASVGPYYAMFPVNFAFEVVQRYSSTGDAVLDPFAGRASSIYAAAASGRTGLGIEINPVGWLYGKVKLRPATKHRVIGRLQEIGTLARVRTRYIEEIKSLPPFFTAAYAPQVLRFLLAARDELAWRTSRVDATLMAFILIYLHGKRSAALSNQLRDGKAMAPDYAVRWWEERGLRPPNVSPVDFLMKRIEWRYKHGAPALDGNVRLGDSTSVLKDVTRRVERGALRPFNLLFTSPPYMGITNYHYDQWLRLWMLGGPSHPHAPELRRAGRWRGKFESRSSYRMLLETVFGRAAEVLTRGATVYVRTDARAFTLETTIEVLRSVFPRKALTMVDRPLMKRTQTALFGDKSDKPGEVDLVLTG